MDTLPVGTLFDASPKVLSMSSLIDIDTHSHATGIPCFSERGLTVARDTRHSTKGGNNMVYLLAFMRYLINY
jgi:hypothetical protein